MQFSKLILITIILGVCSIGCSKKSAPILAPTLPSSDDNTEAEGSTELPPKEEMNESS